MKKKLVFATNNPHKLDEVRAIVGNKFEILSLSDIGCNEDIPETADNLRDNALLKARHIKSRYGYDCFADDTGLEVEVLNGAPGVYSARYAGIAQDSKANREKLLKEISSEDNRKASFRTSIALILDQEEHLFEGIIEGEIITEERGASGFGYDSIFQPKGYKETFAELDSEVKNAISHRAIAVKKLCEFLSI